MEAAAVVEVSIFSGAALDIYIDESKMKKEVLQLQHNQATVARGEPQQETHAERALMWDCIAHGRPQRRVAVPCLGNVGRPSAVIRQPGDEASGHVDA